MTVPRAAIRRTPPAAPGGSLSGSITGPPLPLRAAPRSEVRSPTSPIAARARGTPRARRRSSSASSSAPASESRSSGSNSLPTAGVTISGGRPGVGRDHGRAGRQRLGEHEPERLPDRRQHRDVRGGERAARGPRCGRASTHSAPSGSSTSNPGSRLPASWRRASGCRVSHRARTRRAAAPQALARVGRAAGVDDRGLAPRAPTSTSKSAHAIPGGHDLGLAQQVAAERRSAAASLRTVHAAASRASSTCIGSR